jgi:hypothetical protein
MNAITEKVNKELQPRTRARQRRRRNVERILVTYHEGNLGISPASTKLPFIQDIPFYFIIIEIVATQNWKTMLCLLRFHG